MCLKSRGFAHGESSGMASFALTLLKSVVLFPLPMGEGQGERQNGLQSIIITYNAMTNVRLSMI